MRTEYSLLRSTLGYEIPSTLRKSHILNVLFCCEPSVLPCRSLFSCFGAESIKNFVGDFDKLPFFIFGGF